MTKNQLIGFFDLGNDEVERMAKQFLTISIFGSVFSIVNTLFATLLNSMGNSKQPFQILSVGLMVNIVLDPFFIFGWAALKDGE